VKCQTLGLEFVDFLPAILWGLVTNFRLQQFVNELKIPFFTTQMGKGVISGEYLGHNIRFSSFVLNYRQSISQLSGKLDFFHVLAPIEGKLTRECVVVIADDHPLCLGCAALSSNDFVHVCIEKADLIINIGHDVVEKPPFIMQFVSVIFHLLEVCHASNFATFVPGFTQGVFCWRIYFV
jgi:hypothetical protein